MSLVECIKAPTKSENIKAGTEQQEGHVKVPVQFFFLMRILYIPVHVLGVTLCSTGLSEERCTSGKSKQKEPCCNDFELKIY